MYKNRCLMPFILYPPDMYDIKSNSEIEELKTSLKFDEKTNGFVMYISIPYCRVRCKACPYFIELLPNNSSRKTTLDRYIQAVTQDLKSLSFYDRWGKSLVRGVYIGGGTGSILEIEHLELLLGTLMTYYQLASDCEITLEGNAEDFNYEKANYIANSIINRISLGAQTFQTNVLKTIGSPHKTNDTEKTIKLIQDCGLEHISLDMIYNVPGHTIQQWEKDFEVLSSLGIKHLTTYLYRITPGSQQEKLIKSGKVENIDSPFSDKVVQMQSIIKQFAEQHGMNNYMLEHYAIPGYESKYNHWTMTECADALGVGAGSYSFINQRRSGISKDIKTYIDAVENNLNTFTTAGIKLSNIMSKQRYIIFNLLYFRINKAHYYSAWKSDPYQDFKVIFDKLYTDKIMYDDGDFIRVKDSCKEFVQNIMLEFFDESMWENSKALEQQQSSWAMNNHMIDIGSSKKSYWLERI